MSLFVFCGAAVCSAAEPVLLDNFTTIDAWTAHPADGVQLDLSSDKGVTGQALRMDFSFTGGGYAVARRALDLDLPENYTFSFQLRGDCPVNHLEFKLIDASGENVWWSVRRDLTFPKTWEPFRIRKRQISFAWGPLGGGVMKHAAAVEIVVTAGSGGTGTVWIDDLVMTPLPPADTAPPDPVVSASSEAAGYAARHAMDGDSTTAWTPKPGDRGRWLKLDLRQLREFGGLTLGWGGGPLDYDISLSEDDRTWRVVRTVRESNGGRDDLYLPESESRYLRIHVLSKDAPPLAEVLVRPLEWASSRTAFFENIAREAPRGAYPRGMSGEQVFWAVVGADNDTREGLLSEDGAFEVGPGGFSIEPFLDLGNGRLTTWSESTGIQTLAGGDLPVPTVIRTSGTTTLAITAVPVGPPGVSGAILRYRVTAGGENAVRGRLHLAVRPLQVNPPSQALNLAGGAATIRSLKREGGSLFVNGVEAVIPLDAPELFGASTFDQGDIVADNLAGILPLRGAAPSPQGAGRVPHLEAVTDSFEAASGVLVYGLDSDPGDTLRVDLYIPFHPGSQPPVNVDAAVAGSIAEWRSRLDTFELELPPAAQPVLESLRAQLGWILVNRAGPAIQPGPRSYARSWIRDGALTSSALLKTGHAGAARDFLEWYAPNQYDNGKIPCVVDHRGADPVPEHDSSGEFIFLVAEVYRYTGDRAVVETMWPRVRKAAEYLDALRQERRTDEYRTPEKAEFFGILPPSISHEGYSAKPMHSYWDDFFAVRGFKDAVYLAGVMGLPDEERRLAAIRDEFERDVAASVVATLGKHNIDYVPGCADLGDFDATSTTIALNPTAAADLLPRTAVERTFERYWEFFTARRDGAPWDAYTPYEIRNIGAFVRLGWRDRAQELLRFFLADRKPEGWRQWPEVVRHEERIPHFIGDLPHTWVGSDYVRSVLDMLAYDREADSALVIAAGVPMEWIDAEPGLTLRDLPTVYGPLGYSMKRNGNVIEARIEAGVRMPRGGIVIQPPAGGGIGSVAVDGRAVKAPTDGAITVRSLPASVRIVLR